MSVISWPPQVIIDSHTEVHGERALPPIKLVLTEAQLDKWNVIWPQSTQISVDAIILVIPSQRCPTTNIQNTTGILKFPTTNLPPKIMNTLKCIKTTGRWEAWKGDAARWVSWRNPLWIKSAITEINTELKHSSIYPSIHLQVTLIYSLHAQHLRLRMGKGWHFPRHYLTSRLPAQLTAFREALKHLRLPQACRSERGGAGKNWVLLRKVTTASPLHLHAV